MPFIYCCVIKVLRRIASGKTMQRIAPAKIEGNSFQKHMGHCPEIVEKWFALDEAIRFGGRLDTGLKEEVRRSLAEGIGCRFCSSLGDPDLASRSPRTALAVAFADSVFSNFGDLTAIDDEVFDVLHEEFTEPEIVELVVWTLFMIAGQGFGALMHVPRSTPQELREYIAWRTEGEKAARAGE